MNLELNTIQEIEKNLVVLTTNEFDSSSELEPAGLLLVIPYI